MFIIRFQEKALKSLEIIPEKWQRRIKLAIQTLKDFPFEGKKLQGGLAGLFSLRVWPYRIIYIVKKREITVVILDIGHRQGIYR